MLLTSRPRSAYTLLEVLLASAIGIILLGALYVAMEVQLRHAQAGREVIEQGTLVRALLTRIAADINASVGPTQPVVTAASSGGSSAASGGGTAAAGTTAAAGGTGGAATGASGAAAATAATPGTAVQINFGVQGDNATLVLTVAKWPRELNLSTSASSDQQPAVADLRRISYWLAGAGSGSPLGLARQELKAVTTSDSTLTATPPNIPDEAQYVIAEEVKNVTFQYWDGTAWQDSWDGTQPGADGSTPMGPPIAIAITIDVALPTAANATNDQPQIKSYRQVVSIVTANGATQASSNSTPTTSP
jgi:hypothetical protein